MAIFSSRLISSQFLSFGIRNLSTSKNMSDTRSMSEIMRHSERLTDGNDGVVRSIRDVPITEQRKPFINSKGSGLQHAGTCSQIE